MDYFSQFHPQTFTNFTGFEIQHLKDMLDFDYHYDSTTVKQGFECVDIFVLFLLASSVYLFVVGCCSALFDTFSSSKSSSQTTNLSRVVDGVSCVKVPDVFAFVAKDYFKTDSTICLTFAGKLSLGRYMAKKIVPTHTSNRYLKATDPITKQEFRFIRYTMNDIENMKTATREWIIKNEDKWVSYFAY